MLAFVEDGGRRRRYGILGDHVGKPPVPFRRNLTSLASAVVRLLVDNKAMFSVHRHCPVFEVLVSVFVGSFQNVARCEPNHIVCFADVPVHVFWTENTNVIY